MGVMLAGVFNSGILATGSGPGAKFDYTAAPKPVVDKVKAIEEICKKHQITLRQAAIQFALGHPAVVSVVLGAVKPEEVKSNVHDASVEIPASLWSDLKSAKLLDEAAPTKG
jgi:D-threo-aldose 1-dehydrogenase